MNKVRTNYGELKMYKLTSWDNLSIDHYETKAEAIAGLRDHNAHLLDRIDILTHQQNELEAEIDELQSELNGLKIV